MNNINCISCNLDSFDLTGIVEYLCSLRELIYKVEDGSLNAINEEEYHDIVDNISNGGIGYYFR